MHLRCINILNCLKPCASRDAVPVIFVDLDVPRFVFASDSGRHKELLMEHYHGEPVIEFVRRQCLRLNDGGVVDLRITAVVPYDRQDIGDRRMRDEYGPEPVVDKPVRYAE